MIHFIKILLVLIIKKIYLKNKLYYFNQFYTFPGLTNQQMLVPRIG